MQPRILTLIEKKLLGKKLQMSFVSNRTAELWRDLMPRRREIKNIVSSDLISMTVYNSIPDFSNFDPKMQFEKWAAVEVSDFNVVPSGLNTYILPVGLYAVFFYKGSSTDTTIFQYIFTQWLPASSYELDDRPHFELLGEKYKNADPDSEEQIWIPIRNK